MEVYRGFFYTSSRTGAAYNVVICDVSVREVTYEYRDNSQDNSQDSAPQFTTLSYSMADVRTTQLLATLIDTALVSIAVATRSLGAAIEPGSAFEDTLARSLSISMVAASASIFKDSEAVNAISIKSELVSKIPLVPFVGLSISAILIW